MFVPKNQVPAGEYYFNRLPGDDSGSLQCDQLFSIVNEVMTIIWQTLIILPPLGPTITTRPELNGGTCQFWLGQFLDCQVAKTLSCIMHLGPSHLGTLIRNLSCIIDLGTLYPFYVVLYRAQHITLISRAHYLKLE